MIVDRCLIFGNEESGLAAKKKIWVNRVREKSLEGDNLVGDYSVNYTAAEVAAMDDETVYGLDIYGKVGEKLSTQTKGSEEWAELNKCSEIDQWYMRKPPEEFLAGVIGFMEQDFDLEWQEKDKEA